MKEKTFLDTPAWEEIVNNIKGIMVSDGTMTTLLDFERVLDEADIYAFKNWGLGELVDGPIIRRYEVICTFLWPLGVMPDPRGAKRLLPLSVLSYVYFIAVQLTYFNLSEVFLESHSLQLKIWVRIKCSIRNGFLLDIN